VIKIYSAADVIDAQLVCDALIEAGMQAIIKGAYLTGAGGDLPVDTLVTVWIREPMHRERARKIIDDLELMRKQKEIEIVCANCEALSSNYFSLCWRCGARLE